MDRDTSSGITRAGLILTGGGARAAYQVGVLKALAEIHPRRRWPFPIIVGTSAGAVSASILAANVTRWRQSVAEIEQVWANFRVNHVFRSDALAMLRAGGRWLGSLVTGGMMGPPKSLLDNSPLRELLSRVTDFDAVRVHVARGNLHALALCATSYFTARSVSFFESNTALGEWSRAQRHGERVPLSLDYLMASLGIPSCSRPSVCTANTSATARCARRRRCHRPSTWARTGCWCWACVPRIST
jgi:NTE family protein